MTLLSIILFVMLKWSILLNDKSFEIIATFLSIFIGFCFTALSIITTAKFSKTLFKIESKESNNKTLLHELIDEFRFAILNSTFCIILIILYFSFQQNFDLFFVAEINFSLKSLLSAFIVLFTFISFYYFFNLLSKFLKFIIKESSK